MTQNRIQDWLYSQGVYNAIVQVGGKNYRINSTQGILVANPGDLEAFPVCAAPDWLSDWISSEWSDDAS